MKVKKTNLLNFPQMSLLDSSDSHDTSGCQLSPNSQHLVVDIGDVFSVSSYQIKLKFKSLLVDLKVSLVFID